VIHRQTLRTGVLTTDPLNAFPYSISDAPAMPEKPLVIPGASREMLRVSSDDLSRITRDAHGITRDIPPIRR
jgi:hypothetical protein